jgi:hypothetical protein
MTGTRIEKSKRQLKREERAAQKAAAVAASIVSEFDSNNSSGNTRGRTASAPRDISNNYHPQSPSTSSTSSNLSVPSSPSSPHSPNSPITPGSPATPGYRPAPPGIRSTFRGLGENGEAILAKPLFLASVGGRYHEGESLDSIISLFIKKHSGRKSIRGFNHVDVLVAGALQRYNPWNFSIKLNNNKLKKLFEQVPEHLDINGLATYIANVFYPFAKESEKNYIGTSALRFIKFLPRSFADFIAWERMIPIPNSELEKAQETVAAEAKHSYGNYDAYHKMVMQEYKTNPEFAEAFRKTSERLLEAKKQLIHQELLRIFNASDRLSHFTKGDIQPLARALSAKYLLEECPLLFAELVDKGYTSILYPGAPTEAFKVTQKLFEPAKQIKWVTIYPEPIPEKDDYGLSTELMDSPTSIRQHSNLGANRSFSGNSLDIKQALLQSPSQQNSPVSEPGIERNETSAQYSYVVPRHPVIAASIAPTATSTPNSQSARSYDSDEEKSGVAYTGDPLNVDESPLLLTSTTEAAMRIIVNALPPLPATVSLHPASPISRSSSCASNSSPRAGSINQAFFRFAPAQAVKAKESDQSSPQAVVDGSHPPAPINRK